MTCHICHDEKPMTTLSQALRAVDSLDLTGAFTVTVTPDTVGVHLSRVVRVAAQGARGWSVRARARLALTGPLDTNGYRWWSGTVDTTHGPVEVQLVEPAPEDPARTEWLEAKAERIAEDRGATS